MVLYVPGNPDGLRFPVLIFVLTEGAREDVLLRWGTREYVLLPTPPPPPPPPPPHQSGPILCIWKSPSFGRLGFHFWGHILLSGSSLLSNLLELSVPQFPYL